MPEREANVIVAEAEADLGIFSMFGRTGAPQKGTPLKHKKNSFFGNMVTSQKY